MQHVPVGAVQVDWSHRCHARWAMRCRQDLISWSSRMDAAVVALRAAPRHRGLRPPGTRSRQPPPLLGANTGTKVNSQHALGLRRAQARPPSRNTVWSLDLVFDRGLKQSETILFVSKPNQTNPTIHKTQTTPDYARGSAYSIQSKDSLVGKPN